MKREKNISSLILEVESGNGGESNSIERKSNFSLDFPTFGPSVLVGPRSKVVVKPQENLIF